MKQSSIALALLLAAACSSAGYDSSVDPSPHDDHAQITASGTAPEALLRPDEFDAAVPASVAEAAKAAASAGQAMSHAHHDAHDAEDTAIYACPMHPEVTSATPGTCQKCGMTLIERKKQ